MHFGDIAAGQGCFSLGSCRQITDGSGDDDMILLLREETDAALGLLIG